MTVEPRAALERLFAALERHYEAAGSARDPDHPLVIAAAQDLAEAFDVYDEALFVSTEVATPLAVYGDDFDGHADDADEGGVYAGLDPDEYDDDEDDEFGEEDDDLDDLDDEDEEDDLDDDEDEDDDEDDEADDLDEVGPDGAHSSRR